MDLAVVGFAEHDQVVEFGGSFVSPVVDVVDVAPGRWSVAAGVGAAAVSDGDGFAEPVGDGALLPAHVQWLAVAVHDDGDDAGVAGQGAQRGGGDGAAELQHRPARSVLEVLESDDHGEVGAAAAGLGEVVAVVEDVPADVGERFGLSLGRGPVVVGGQRPGLGVDDRGDGVVEGGVFEPALDRPACAAAVAGQAELVGRGRGVVGLRPVLVQSVDQQGAEAEQLSGLGLLGVVGELCLGAGPLRGAEPFGSPGAQDAVDDFDVSPPDRSFAEGGGGGGHPRGELFPAESGASVDVGGRGGEGPGLPLVPGQQV
nr:hypothetical protein [Pseudonocardia petroleophila]